jgi:hypothetical protein
MSRVKSGWVIIRGAWQIRFKIHGSTDFSANCAAARCGGWRRVMATFGGEK